jgi:hypothetical protein
VLSALSPVEISGTEHNSVYGHVLAKLGLVAHQVKGPAVTPGLLHWRSWVVLLDLAVSDRESRP